MISVIIRTRNEERWIGQCLKMVLRQSVKNIEIILVDNNSADKTKERAKHEYPELKVIQVNEYMPGLALNMGVQASTGKYIAILSAHCIPLDTAWLRHLVENLEDKDVAGVYGRQLPMKFSTALDKRDLLVTFGLDKRIQRKDSFFHNANSMIRRDIWKKYPFDEELTNIEDRVWGKKVIEAGYKLVYEPKAVVNHYHGIHQNNDEERVNNVVRIMEGLNLNKSHKTDVLLERDTLEVVAIIPVKGENENEEMLNTLLKRTVASALDSKTISRVIVSTDDERIKKAAEKLGAEVPFIRPPELSAKGIRVDDVLIYTLGQLESEGYFPDIVIPIEITYPFRPESLLDKLVEQLIERGLDTVIPGFAEYRLGWWKNDDEFVRVDKFSTLKSKREPLHIGLISMGCATYPEIIRKGSRIGNKVGVVEIKNAISTFEVRNKEDLASISEYLCLL